MPLDVYANFTPSLGDPARDTLAVTTNDALPLATLPRAIYVGTGGTVVLPAVDSVADVTLKNVASGQLRDIRASQVRTTAADLVGLA